MTPEELLAQYEIKLKNTAPGRYYTTCPQCSANRKAAHRKLKCLGVTIDDASACWQCNHCKWKGPEKGTGRSNGQAGDEDFAATYDYAKDGIVKFQKVRKRAGSRGGKYFIRRPDGNGGWINGTNGVDTTILYRIDDVNEAIAQPARRSRRFLRGERGRARRRRLRPHRSPAHCVASPWCCLILLLSEWAQPRSPRMLGRHPRRGARGR